MISSRRNLLKLMACSATVPLLPKIAGAQDRRAVWHVLGSNGGPRVVTNRSNPANVLMIGDTPYIVDCGYGVTRQLVRAGLPLTSLEQIFITHLHSDHALECGNLIYCSWSTGLDNEVTVHAPEGAKAMMDAYMESIRFDLDVRIEDENKPDLRNMVKVREIGDSGVVFENSDVTVTAFRTPHPPIVKRNYAFRFDVAEGSFVYACDTAYNPALADFAQGADVLIHEALYEPGFADMAVRSRNKSESFREHIFNSHTSTEHVGQIAAAAKVKKLVLSHLVPGDDESITDDMWLEGVRRHYDGEAIVAHDFMEITI